MAQFQATESARNLIIITPWAFKTKCLTFFYFFLSTSLEVSSKSSVKVGADYEELVCFKNYKYHHYCSRSYKTFFLRQCKIFPLFAVKRAHFVNNEFFSACNKHPSFWSIRIWSYHRIPIGRRIEEFFHVHMISWSPHAQQPPTYLQMKRSS